MRGYLAFRKVLLQPRHLSQRARSLNSSAHSPLLIISIDAIFVVRRIGAIRTRYSEPFRFDAHDLCGKLSRLF